MTIAQQLLQAGAMVNRSIHGKPMVTDDGQSVIVEVAGMVDFSEPGPFAAKAKNPVYVELSVIQGTIRNPRSIKTFMETESQRLYYAREFLERPEDVTRWSWKCEAQRI